MAAVVVAARLKRQMTLAREAVAVATLLRTPLLPCQPARLLLWLVLAGQRRGSGRTLAIPAGLAQLRSVRLSPPLGAVAELTDTSIAASAKREVPAAGVLIQTFRQMRLAWPVLAAHHMLIRADMERHPALRPAAVAAVQAGQAQTPTERQGKLSAVLAFRRQYPARQFTTELAAVEALEPAARHQQAAQAAAVRAARKTLRAGMLPALALAAAALALTTAERAALVGRVSLLFAISSSNQKQALRRCARNNGRPAALETLLSDSFGSPSRVDLYHTEPALCGLFLCQQGAFHGQNQCIFQETLGSV